MLESVLYRLSYQSTRLLCFEEKNYALVLILVLVIYFSLSLLTSENSQIKIDKLCLEHIIQ